MKHFAWIYLPRLRYSQDALREIRRSQEISGNPLFVTLLSWRSLKTFFKGYNHTCSTYRSAEPSSYMPCHLRTYRGRWHISYHSNNYHWFLSIPVLLSYHKSQLQSLCNSHLQGRDCTARRLARS